ncbi:hypothetical protein ABZY58_11505 [Micromonospora tulbaghiae]|uniref:hypothetical protein n=1 Tax=Micromonospora tulbaghiae TaxID=479978 RepID=UPI00339F482D
MTYTPSPDTVTSGDVQALISHPGAVLVYAPAGHPDNLADTGSAFAVIPWTAAKRDRVTPVAYADTVLGRHGNGPYEDVTAQHAADAINARTM